MHLFVFSVKTLNTGIYAVNVLRENDSVDFLPVIYNESADTNKGRSVYSSIILIPGFSSLTHFCDFSHSDFTEIF